MSFQSCVTSLSIFGYVKKGAWNHATSWLSFLLNKFLSWNHLDYIFSRFKGTFDILFSIPQLVDVLRRLERLDISFNSNPITVNTLNVLRSCKNTELAMVNFDCFGEDGNWLNDLLSFLVDMSGNIKHFTSSTSKQPPLRVSDLDILRQLHTSHEIILRVLDKKDNPSIFDIYHIDIQKCVTEEERRKSVFHMEIIAR